jgi:hypothetical protein
LRVQKGGLVLSSENNNDYYGRSELYDGWPRRAREQAERDRQQQQQQQSNRYAEALRGLRRFPIYDREIAQPGTAPAPPRSEYRTEGLDILGDLIFNADKHLKDLEEDKGKIDFEF